MKVKTALSAALVLLISEQIKDTQALVIRQKNGERLHNHADVDDEDDDTAKLQVSQDVQDQAEAEVSKALAEQADADEKDLQESRQKKQKE